MASLTHTVSGNSNLVSFKSAARVPIESLKCHFKPKQDFNGYSKPWIGGSGKNLFDESSVTFGKMVSKNKTIIDAVYAAMSSEIYIYGQTSVTLMYNGVNPNTIHIVELDNEKNIIKRTSKSWTGNNDTALIITPNADTYYIYICISANDSDVIMTAELLSSYKLQLEIGSTATSYEPYENICPIEGWNNLSAFCNNQTIPITFPATGKNLINQSLLATQSGITLEDGFYKGSRVNFFSSFPALANIYYKENTQYTISLIGKNATVSGNSQICFYYTDGTTSIASWSSTEETMISLTSDSGKTIRYVFFQPSGGPTVITYIKNLQIEEGTTATEYEPFKNTVYGGYVDIAKGELIQTYSYVQYDSSNLNYLWYSFNNSAAPIGIGFRKNISNDFNLNTDILCDKLSILNNETSQNFPYLYAYINNSSVYGCIYIGTTADYPNLQTQEDVQNMCKNWVDEHGPFMIARKFKNPITYKLSPTQLQTLLGQNNFWSNTNDVTEVSYAIHDSAPIRAAKQRIAAFNARKIADLKNILRSNYLPNGATWVDEVDIDFDAGDYIEASIDVSGCTGVNENILSIGSIIDTWSVANSPSHVSGTEDIVVHFYYPSTSGSTQLANDLTYTAVTDGTETKHTSNLNKITLSDTTLIIKIDKNNVYVNGTEIITGNFIYTAMTIFQDKTKLLIGSLEGSNRSHAAYNYIKVVRGQ